MSERTQEEKEAIRRYQTGERLNFSTGIDDCMTYGYGELSPYGFWEFPLPFDYLSTEHKALVMSADDREDGKG